MPELNKANRQVCDVDIRFLATMAPFLDFRKANTTTVGLTGETTYARAKGMNAIGFPDPIQGTMTIEAQVYPYKLFAAMSDGQVSSDAVYAVTDTVVASTAGELDLNAQNGTIGAGTVFVYPEDAYADANAQIPGTFSGVKFTATTASDIEVGKSYKAAYLVTKTSGVKRVSFNNNKLPPDYFITMKTADKNENGEMTAFLMTAYKAVIQRNFELSFSSEGDPATVSLTFDLMVDKDENVLDFVELDDEDTTPAYTFTAVETTTDKHPVSEGWYELSGYTYIRSNDEDPVEGKTYYIRSAE